MKTLAALWEQVAARHAERTALVDAGRAITYATLSRHVQALAATLAARGVRRGDRVTLLLPNGAPFVTSYFAIVALGAVAVPLDDHYRERELEVFLRDCGASLVITAPEGAPLCERVLAGHARDATLVLAPGPVDLTPTPVVRTASPLDLDPGALAVYQFSSGSTGPPKRIARTHADLLFEVESLVRTFDIRPEDRVLGVTPFSHINGLMRSMMASLAAGATLYPLARFERHAVADAIEQHRITMFIGVPFMFAMLARTAFRRPPDISSLRWCVSASAPMLRALNEAFHGRFGAYVRQLYGSTETGTISVNVALDIRATLESVGTPLDGVEVAIFTEDGCLAGPGVVGEVAVRSPGAIRRYDSPDNANAGAFRDGYFLTGDLGHRDRDGFLYLVGRKKLFINRAGYKINPGEIEEVLGAHPAVGEVAVVGVPTPYGDEKVKAVVVLNGPCNEGELIDYCRGKVADFKVPSVIEFRHSLPKSQAGKIRRGLLT